MSGPKVVRIVTREEAIATCERDLQRLDKALARWENQASRLAQFSDAERAAAQPSAAMQTQISALARAIRPKLCRSTRVCARVARIRHGEPMLNTMRETNSVG